MMNEEAELRQRLRNLGRRPVDPDVAATHLARAGVRGGRDAMGPRVVGGGIAAALIGTLVIAGVGVAQRDDGGPNLPPAAPPEDVPPAAPPEDVPPVDVTAPPVAQIDDDSAEDDGAGSGEEATSEEDAAVELECTGPPPFAGTPPGDGGARAAEAAAFSTFRAEECPDTDEEAEDGDGADENGDTTPEDEAAGTELECTGPPPFAGIPAEDGQERAAEAHELAEFRATQCPDDASASDEDLKDGGEPAEAGRPESAGRPPQAGPPTSVGPPASAGRPPQAGPPTSVGPPAEAGRPAANGTPARGRG